jgi:hypothetical protein
LPQSGGAMLQAAGPLQFAVVPSAQRLKNVQQQFKQPHAPGSKTEWQPPVESQSACVFC